MFTSTVDDYQKQFSEWQKLFSEWQKKYFDTWVNMLQSAKPEGNLSESFDKALNLQEEVVKAYLEAQEKTTQMMLDSQRKFWNDYFGALRNKSTTS